jgi:predicted AAA+ superfamily ATPase
MTLTPQGYRERWADAAIASAGGLFGAVLVEGPKWCGKTWTALNHANSAVSLADPAGSFAAREIARSDPAAILSGQAPRLVDEWQEAPGVWDAVRFAVDAKPQPGRFLLTGSTTPPMGAVAHSGAGRIARVRMRTMSLSERGAVSARTSLRSLLNGEPPETEFVGAGVSDVVGWLCSGGWPAALHLDHPDGIALASSYLDAIAAVDLLDIPERYDQASLRTLLRCLARTSTTLVSRKSILADVVADGGSISSRNTLRRYLELLERLYVIDRIPAWHPSLRSKLRLRRASKHILADVTLTLAALGAGPDSLLRDASLLGAAFEELCLHDLGVYCEAAGARLFHYHDEDGLEVDAIVEAADGAWAGVEIKLGAQRVDEGAAALTRLTAKLRKHGGPPPIFLAVVTGTGPTLVRADGILAINIGSLRP